MDLSHLAQSGTVIAVRVTPAARRNEVAQGAHGLRIWVTAAPENGKATKAVIKVLAKSLGVAKSRISLVKGATARDKLFRVD